MKSAIFAHEIWLRTRGRRGEKFFLSREDWPGIQVKGRQLAEASFYKCDLSKAHFDGCNFVASAFRECRLYGVTFQNCDLSNVTFEDCDLTESLFINCVTTGIKTDGSDLTESNL